METARNSSLSNCNKPSIVSIKVVEGEPTDLFSRIKAGGRGFTVKTSYELACPRMEEVSWECWRALWKMKMIQRVKVFAWLMAHGKLLTNNERWRRRLSVIQECGRCHQVAKDVMHAIRDCLWAREVWEILIP